MLRPECWHEGDEDETMGGHRIQQQQYYCHQACFMRGAIADIKSETPHGLKLNNIELKALTTTEIQDDPFFCSVSSPSKLIHDFIEHIQDQAPPNQASSINHVLRLRLQAQGLAHHV